MSDEIRQKVGINLEDLLYYADDVLVLCMNPDQLKNCIKVIEEWCRENGMTLNKKKSGIVIFTRRRKRKVPNLGEDVAGVPITNIWAQF